MKSLLFTLLIISSSSSVGEELKIAVAANFKTTAQKIVDKFSQKTSHNVTLISASSSALATQIYHGAPYDLFLSADKERAQWLIENARADADSLIHYATGQLAFFTQKEKITSVDELKTSIKSQTGKLAIANPKFAPYGLSSLELIKRIGVKNEVSSKLVTGNNVIQALQFVTSGNAQSGFVSLSQLKENNQTSHYFVLPRHLYPPIKQYAVITKHGSSNTASKAFLNFLTIQSKTTISNSGYLIGDSNE
ncbi:molybdate ABC transporter substrate-binding protein [Psychrobium sp. nBUS_13]|uniref:molybdate ABC transporter substrate-binding protein n=1 Tax=Psychrobium sp. nBUS_13 TaxID=3395319 RepID=UPI003EB7E706